MTGSFVVLSVFFSKQKTAYEMRISDWSSDVCSSDLPAQEVALGHVDVLGKRTEVDVVHGVAPGIAHHVPGIVVGVVVAVGVVRVRQAVEIGRASCRERVCQYV